MTTSRRNIVLGVLCAVWPVVVNGQTDLSGLVTRAAANSELKVGEGTYKLPIAIDRPLSLKGDHEEKCVLEVTADQPAFTISGTGPVTIESLTIKWQLATSEGGRKGPATAVLVKDGNVKLRNCRMIALGNGARCPMAVASTGFSKVSLDNCRFEGFEFTIGYSGGAEGSVTDCQVLNPGHCGITVSSGSKVEVTRNIVTRSKYHGLRCTGGTLIANDNLIIANKNRGIYLGNKSASGRVNNNVIMGNATGIGAFAQSDVTIENLSYRRRPFLLIRAGRRG